MATKDYSVTFTPNDAASTGASEMGYEIRTAASGGGTLLTSGTCTSGTPVTTATFNDAGLASGANTRYVRTRDGAANWTDTSFTATYTLSGMFVRRRSVVAAMRAANW